MIGHGQEFAGVAEGWKEPVETADTYNRIQKNLERNGHRVNEGQLRSLFSSLEFADLSADKLAEKLGRVPLAKVRGRELTIDHRFHDLDPEQQEHVVLHEYSHRLADFFASREQPEQFQALAERIEALPPEQISYYIGFLTESFGDDPANAAMLQYERLAETLAQYLESDRSFSGFLQAKLREFPNQEDGLSDEQQSQFREFHDQIGSLEQYLRFTESDDERDAFLAHHPGLTQQYEIWQELGALFEETDFGAIDEFNTTAVDTTPSLGGDEDYFDLYELANDYHLPEPQRPANGGQSPSNKKPGLLSDLISFWRLFSDKPESD